MSARDQFGGASNTGGGNRCKNFVGEDLYKNGIRFRILPAMKSLRTKGTYATFHRQHFGYFGVDFKDPTKSVARPFACIEKVDRTTEMVTVSCPECREIERHEVMLKDAKEKVANACRTAGVLNAKDVELAQRSDEQCKSLSDWLYKHNLSKKWHIAIVTEAGEPGLLAVGNNAKKDLFGKVDDLRKRGLTFEPIANLDAGYYWQLKMTNPKKQDNITTFDVATEGRPDGSFTYKLAPLSDALLEKVLESVPDLTDANLRWLSAAQIKMLTTSSGEPEEVEAIMKMASSRPGEATPPETSPDHQQRPQQAAQTAQEPAAPEVQRPVASATVAVSQIQAQPTTEVDEEAALAAQLAALQEKKRKAAAATAAAAQQAAQAPAATKPTMNPMDPNLKPTDFAKLFPPPR